MSCAKWLSRSSSFFLLRVLAATVAVWLFDAPRLEAQSYCSLVVNVVDPQGRAVHPKISVQESDGRIVENTLGAAEICGLGLGPVTVTVGSPGCNQPVLRNVGLRWGVTTKVKVTYDLSGCNVDGPPVAACQMLFRFEDAEQHGVPTAVLKEEAPENKTIKADEYGRVHIAIAASKELRAVGTAPGYDSAPIQATCTHENRRLEQRISLKKSASAQAGQR